MFELNYDRIERLPVLAPLWNRLTGFELNYDRIERDFTLGVRTSAAEFELNYDRIESFVMKSGVGKENSLNRTNIGLRVKPE